MSEQAQKKDPFGGRGGIGGGGQWLRFKDGQFTYDNGEQKLLSGTRMVPAFDELQTGWVKWQNDEIVERNLIFASEGGEPAGREDLGDDDQEEWERDEKGQPIDPWRFTAILPMSDPASGMEFIFSTSSVGGVIAVRRLWDAFTRQRESNKDKKPVIELKSGNYQHKEYGTVQFPRFNIINWQGLETTTSLPAELDDEIPF